MAIILEAVGASGDVQSITLSGGAARVQALPGLQYRLRDTEGGRLADGARVKRVGDDLVVEGLPGEGSVALEGFFTRCAPGNTCSLSMENLGGSAGDAILPSTQPVGAYSDGSFLMYASGAAAPTLPTEPESETSYKPALGALAGLAVVGGGCGGGGGDSSSDSVAPPPPLITSGEFTNKATPVIAGTAEAGATVTVTLDAGSDGSSDVTYATQADANGVWSIDTATATPSFGSLPAIAEGVPTALIARATDAAGNISEPTTATLTLDSVPPGPPTITSALLTNDATPVIQGAADPGAIVIVSLDLDSNGSFDVSWTTVASSLGTYSVDLGTPPSGGTLPGGALGAVSATPMQVEAWDLAGNQSGSPATAVLSVDTRLPSPPVIATIAGDNAINAAESAGSIIISGTISEPDRPVTFQWGGFTETFTATGTAWSVTVPSGSIPADGLQTVVVTYLGAAGSTSIAGTQDVLIDRVVPGAPLLSLSPVSDTGVAGDRITSDDTPTLRVALAGTGAQAGDSVSLLSGAATVGSAVLDDADISAGYVEVTPVSLGADGVKTLTATITDAAVNVSAPSAALALTVDRTAPTLAITDNAGGNATGPVTFTFTFSEPVLGFTADDVTVTGGTKGTFSQTGAATYTLVVTPPADTNGEISVTVPAGAVTDVAGTATLSPTVAVQPYTLAVPPTVDITDNEGGIANSAVTFTFSFSEPVTGFDAGDIAVTNGTKGAFAQTGATTYTLVVTPPANATGTMTVTVPAGAAIDSVGNPSVGPVSATQAFDTAAPTLAITDNVDGIANGNVTFLFTFNEAVSGFGSADVVVTGGSKGSFSAISATTYSLVVIPAADATGTITVSVGAGVATDAAGNSNVAAAPVTQDFDTAVPPTVTITDNFSGAGDVANGNVTFTFTFSEPVNGFAAGDVDVAGGSPVSFAQTGALTYDLVVAPPANATGTITVEVPAAAATDLAGNPSVGPVSAAQAFDTAAPTIDITQIFDLTGVIDNLETLDEVEGPVIVTNDSTPTLTLDFNELFAVDILRNGSVIDTLAPAAAGPVDYDDTDTLTDNGSYTYTARMTDAAGNVGTSAAYTIVFETISG